MRIRTIKPEFFTHEGIQAAEAESGLPLRLAFIGLWCAADREGRFRWEPRRLGVMILPYDNCDFGKILDALERAGFLVRYGGGKFGFIPSFASHQRINTREADSQIPAFETPAQDSSLQRTCTHPDFEIRGMQDDGEGKGREGSMEGKGREWEEPAPGFSNRPVETSPPVSLAVAMANAGQYGTTPEIAKAWWLKRDGIGWMERGQPITRWHSNLKAFADTWGGIENKPPGSKFGRPEASVSTTSRMPGYDF